MGFLVGVWIPILLSAVFVFVLSSIIHMLIPYHKTDFGKLPNEAEAMAALRKCDIPPGDYVMPHSESMKECNSPEFIEKTTQGPVAFMTFLPNGPMKMAGSMVAWFVYCAIVGCFAAYIGYFALGQGAHYLQVFRIVGAAAFAGYSLALLQNSIWYKRSWSSTFKTMFDGLLYALVTGGTFGWLWPV